jgi:hypothetical protein
MRIKMMNSDSKKVYETSLNKKQDLVKIKLDTIQNSDVKNENIKFDIDDGKSEITIIISHANTEHKKNLLKECLLNISGEKIVSSNFPVDPDIQSLSDFVLYDKKNELLYSSEYGEYNLTYYSWWRHENGEIITEEWPFETGYGSYSLMKNGLLFSKSIGKKIVHIVNYDCLLTDELLSINRKHLDTYDSVVYNNSIQKKNDGYVTWFFSSKIDPVLKFYTQYDSKKDYYSSYVNNETVFLEGKFRHYYDNNSYKVLENEIDNFPNGVKMDRNSTFTMDKLKES